MPYAGSPPPAGRHALAKLDAVYFGVGYPEKWPDYSALAIDPADAFGNLHRLARWNYQNALAPPRPARRPHRLVDATPQTPGAVLLFQQNAYNFAAALLQPPKFDASASDAATYGAIGAIVGHEVSHFVDTLGADYDARGASGTGGRRRTSRSTSARPRRSCGSSRATVRSRTCAVDGKRTLVENVADLAGVAAAFDAHRRRPGREGRRPGVRARAGPAVLHRVRARVAREVSRRGSARAGGHATATRPRTIASPRCATSTRGTTHST